MKISEEVLRDMYNTAHQVAIEAARKSIEPSGDVYIATYERVIEFLIQMVKKYQVDE